MKISVKVKPNSKHGLVEPAGEKSYVVCVKEKAIEGRANNAVIKLLSEYFNIPKIKIRVVRGMRARNKIIEVG